MLSMVNMLLVMASPLFRRPLLDSFERSCPDESGPPALPELDMECSDIDLLPSTMVGLLDLVLPFRVSVGDPYMLSILVCASPRSCMSRRYAMTERSARVYASRALSSSLR